MATTQPTATNAAPSIVLKFHRNQHSPPRMPRYLWRIWRALKECSASTPVKVNMVSLFARQVESFARAERDFYTSPAKGSADRALVNLYMSERLGLLACGLDSAQIGNLIDQACRMLIHAETKEPTGHEEN